MSRIKVLIVDDSLLFREVLKQGLSSDADIQVVATAGDPFEARDKILQFEPDVMTLDVEMPKMSGIEFLRRLIPQYPLPVIVISAVNEAVFDATHAGAVDFVTKPDVQSARRVADFFDELIRKIKIASQANVRSTSAVAAPEPIQAAGKYAKRIIAIGASTGGTEAIFSVLKSLPPTVPGIVIVQHIPPVFSRMYAERLAKFTKLAAKEAETGDVVKPGTVLVAPGDQHMRVRKAGEQFTVECFRGDKVNGHCPSVDVLFESVAKHGGAQAVGIILTGMGYDGAKGLLAMRRAGARTVGQDEKSSVVYGMPKVAYSIGAVEKQVALQQIPQLICAML